MTHRACVMRFLVVLVLAALAQAQTFTTLYSFTGGWDGGVPYAGVVQDAHSNLYGTTYGGGNGGCLDSETCGVVYKVDTEGSETVMHSFSGDPDGAIPYTPVVRDRFGNIYGTTAYGGSNGSGAVFKIDSTGKERVLYSFTGGSDGCCPSQGLVIDKTGNLYGTTIAGGSSGGGTIFKLDGAGDFNLLHTFTASDGHNSEYGHLTMDKVGNLYGLTSQGGSTGCTNGCGVLYEVSKTGRFAVLYSFEGGTKNGCWPFGSVALDQAGNLYGTTSQCGSKNYGTIWKVSKRGKKTILHNFAGNRSDACYPDGGVALDPNGNLYGVGSCGANSDGTLYRLSANGKVTLLHNFDNSPPEGAFPVGEVLRTARGKIYGTTMGGGTYYAGTVWSYVP